MTYELDTLVKLLKADIPEHASVTVPVTKGAYTFVRDTLQPLEEVSEPRGHVLLRRTGEPFYIQRLSDRLSIYAQDHTSILTTFPPFALVQKGRYLALPFEGYMFSGIPAAGQLWILPEEYSLGTRHNPAQSPVREPRGFEIL